MPNHPIKMIKLRQVFGLYGSGYGSRSISTTLGISRTTIRKYLRIFNESCAPIWPPTHRFLKDLMLAGLPQIIPQKVWSFRAWRKSSLESLMFAYLAMKEGVVILVEYYCKGMTLNFRH